MSSNPSESSVAPGSTGGPAFPESYVPDLACPQSGMTLRDYMAAKALQALMMNHKLVSSLYHRTNPTGHVAKLAYDHADAMLSARNQ